jgi:C-terminal processing protease CtpA/Prc
MQTMRFIDPRRTPLALAVLAALPAGVASLSAQQPAPRPAPATAPRVTARPCDTCDAAARVSAQRRLESAQRELERAMVALAAQREALLASGDTSRELREAYARMESDARRARRRYDDLLSAMMHQQLARSRLDAERAMMSARAAVQMPSGWLGATLSMQYTLERDGAREIMRFKGYPVVESVEPNSPAERAGLEARDRLVALNGRDVLEGTEPFARLLRPGRRLQMRVKRGDSTKDLAVVVGRRPEGEWGSAYVMSQLIGAPPAEPALRATVGAPAAPLVPPLPPVSAVPLSVVTRDGIQIELGGLEAGTIAGAQLQRVGELKDYFGVDDGLLVLRIIPGTVAARSGLRGGDVILRADGAPITTPLTFRRAMDRSSDQSVKLEVVRKRKKENIVLRWDR